MDDDPCATSRRDIALSETAGVFSDASIQPGKTWEDLCMFSPPQLNFSYSSTGELAAPQKRGGVCKYGCDTEMCL